MLTGGEGRVNKLNTKKKHFSLNSNILTGGGMGLIPGELNKSNNIILLLKTL